MTICIDVVIPCAGRADDLLRLLASLHTFCAASLAAHVVSITVSDDRHSAALGERVQREFPSVRYVVGPARGPAANRNHGASLGGADWLLFLDDDCFLKDDLVRAYVEKVGASPDVQVVEGAIHAVGSRPNGNHHAPLNVEGGVLWSCNFLVRRAAFVNVGRFDERFPFACLEDCDLMDRVRAQGLRFEFARRAIVCHPWRSISEIEVSRQLISHAIYADKYPAFAARWGVLHTLRSMRAKLRQYGRGGCASIPISKYRAVGFDLVAPLLLYAVMHVPPLRNRLCRPYTRRRS